jgi:predicted permease
MERLIQDLRYGLRQLLKHPGFTLLGTLALGLGISAVTVQFAVFNTLFLRGLPFDEGGRIVHIERVNVVEKDYTSEVGIAEFLEWRQRQEVFESLAAFYTGTANLTLGGHVNRYSGGFVTGDTFALLRVGAAQGRSLGPADDLPGAAGVVLLSDHVWRRDFAADPEVIGAPAILNGRPVTVVGVMPPGFRFPVNEDLWVPLFQQQDPGAASWSDPGMYIEPFGRLKPGVDHDAASAAMSRLAIAIADAHPDTHGGFRAVDVRPFVEEFLGDETRAMTIVMMTVTVLILLIACANVATLLMARSMRRRKETAIRSALGASRQRIIRQFLTESLLLAVCGTLLGLASAVGNLRGIAESAAALETPFWMTFEMDLRVFAVVLVLTVFTGIVSGLVPALRASRLNEAEVMKDDTRIGSSLHIGRFSRALVVAQVSIAAVIMSMVVLFVLSTRNTVSLDYHYDPDALMSARVGLFEEAYPAAGDRGRFLETLLRELRERPEITHAATTSRFQFIQGAGIFYRTENALADAGAHNRLARFQRVSPGFLETVGLPLLSGRAFRAEDFLGDQPRVALVNRVLAVREWSLESALGKRILLNPEAVEAGAADPHWVEVVGVVEGMQEAGLFELPEGGAGLILPQTPATVPVFATVLVRGPGDPRTLPPVLREVVGALDPNLPLYEVGTPREVNEKQLAQFRFFASIFTTFGVLGAFLTAVGIHGVITFSVSQRIMEFGIRQAMGATRWDVVRLVYAHAFRQLAVGFLIALLALSPVILADGVRDSLSMFFQGMHPDSVFPYLLSFGFVALIAVLAATPPAIRAARVQPANALRHE